MLKILNKLKDNRIWVGFFIFFLVIFFLSPISGDDWGNYVEGSQGIRRTIGVSLGMYFDWEGRFISRLLILFLTYHKTLWNIINAFVITGGLYLSFKFIRPKNKETIYLILGIILLINISIFKEVFVWIAGNITYLFPFFGIIAYLYLLEKEGKLAKVALLLLSIMIPMFVEHMAFVLTVLNAILIIYSWTKDKKINYFYCVLFILSLGSSFLMLISPGSAYRKLIENVEFNNLSFLDKIKYNVPNFFLYTFTKNIYLVLLMAVTFVTQIKKDFKNKRVIYLGILIGLFSILLSLDSLLIKSLSFNNLLIIIFWSLYFGYLIYSLLREKVYRNELFLIFLGLLSNAIMLYSPVWGYRTTFSTYMFLSLAFVSIIDKNIKIRKIALNSIKILLIVSSILYLVLYINVYIANKERERVILEDLEKDVIRIEYITEIANTNINIGNEYHDKVFKKYYGIDQEKTLVIMPNNWKWKIIYIKE